MSFLYELKENILSTNNKILFLHHHLSITILRFEYTDKYAKKNQNFILFEFRNQMASSSTTITVSGHNSQWEWEGDKSIWQQYPINIQQEISQAFDAGKKEVNDKRIFN